MVYYNGDVTSSVVEPARWKRELSTAPTQMIPRKNLNFKGLERDFDKMLALVLKGSHLEDIDTYIPGPWLSNRQL